MASYEDIQRIAKMLARANSPEQGEAQTALASSYKRMQRDGVKFEDLLRLPKDELFQNTLFKLADLIVNSQENLSPSAKREVYEQYALLIVAKWAGAWEGQARAGQSDKTDSDESSKRSREEAAAKYERRRREQEAERSRNRGDSNSTHRGEGTTGQGYSGNGNSGFDADSHEDRQTPNQGRVYRFKVGKGIYAFSTGPLLDGLRAIFGRGSIIWHTLHQPTRGLRLFAASLLWGMGFAIVILTIAALIHALTGTRPLWDVRLKNIFSLLTAIGTIWKARVFYQSGWFR